MLDVSGTHRAQVRATPETTTVLGTMTVDAAQAASGLLTMTLPAAVSDHLPVNIALAWDLEWTNLFGARRTLVRGTMIVTGDVSR